MAAAVNVPTTAEILALMLGLVVVGTPSITTMAFAVAFAVTVAVAVAITLLPALLGMAGASNPAGDTTIVQAVPLTGPAEAATKDLLERMRGDVLPAVESTHGIEVYVAGPTALGIVVAVLLDATVIRLILVPSTMVMFNRANWWLPAWLDRILPNVDIKGEQLLDELDSAD